MAKLHKLRIVTKVNLVLTFHDISILIIFENFGIFIYSLNHIAFWEKSKDDKINKNAFSPFLRLIKSVFLFLECFSGPYIWPLIAQ